MKTTIILLFSIIALACAGQTANVKCEGCNYLRSKQDSFITQEKSLSMVLDSMFFKVRDYSVRNYFVLITMTGYKDNFDSPEGPLFQGSYITSQTITPNGDSLALLTRIVLSKTYPLDLCSRLRLELSIVKRNPQAPPGIMTALDALVRVGTQAGPVGFAIKQLLQVQRNPIDPDSSLLYVHDFYIPQNTANYAGTAEENKDMLLLHHQPMAIILNTSSKAPVLRESKISSIYYWLGRKYSEIFPGKNFAEKNVPVEGVFKFYFETNDFTAFPPEITMLMINIANDINTGRDKSATERLSLLDMIIQSQANPSAKMFDVTANQAETMVWFHELALTVMEFNHSIGKIPVNADSAVRASYLHTHPADTAAIRTICSGIDKFNNSSEFNSKEILFRCEYCNPDAIDPQCKYLVWTPRLTDPKILRCTDLWQHKMQLFKMTWKHT